MAEFILKSKEEFETVTGTGVSAVAFSAAWCGPCQMLAPVLEAMHDSETRYAVHKIDAEENSEVSMKYSIMALPTVIIFKDGEVVDQFVGVKPREDIATLVEKYL
ncbi:MAG: thioredoxin family protein [Mycoplasmatales bacterium]